MENKGFLLEKFSGLKHFQFFQESIFKFWHCSALVITNGELHPAKSELRFRAGLYSTRGVSKTCDEENFQQRSQQLEIRLNAPLVGQSFWKKQPINYQMIIKVGEICQYIYVFKGYMYIICVYLYIYIICICIIYIYINIYIIYMYIYIYVYVKLHHEFS